MEPRGSSVLYYFPELRKVVIRCRDSENWITDNIVMEGAGILGNVQHCHISAGNLYLYAEIRGETNFEETNLRILYPPQLTQTTNSELQ